MGAGGIGLSGQQDGVIGHIGQIGEGSSVNLNSVLDVFNSSHSDESAVPTSASMDTSMGFNSSLAQKDLEEEGNTDSVGSADDCQELEEAYEDKLWTLVKTEDDTDACVKDGKQNYVMCEGIGSARIPEVPKDWEKPAPRDKQGEPPFNIIDNPGDWDPYTFTAKFEGKNNSGKYLYHKLPTGVTPVPKDPKSGKRIVDGWEFHYKGWKNTSTGKVCHQGVTNTNPFPKERQGRADYKLLKKMGLTKDMIMGCDALFFKQLL